MEKDIYDNLINYNIKNKPVMSFDYEVENEIVYNQKESYLCWLYAATKMLENEFYLKYNYQIHFSINYISFFDRFEKLDLLYNKIISEEVDYLQVKYILFDYINTCGDFSSFKYLVQKYGIVLEEQMPMVENNFIPNDINEIIKEKVIADIEIILKNKSKNSLEELYILKEKMMKENYEILCKIFGEPPKTVDRMIPIEFYNRYISSILIDYIEVMSISSKPYNAEYEMNFNIPNLKNTLYINLNIESVKKAIIKSLRAGKMVWFGCSLRYMSGSNKNKIGLLFSDLYDFKKIGIKKLTKTIAEKYDFLNYDHAMLFTGVSIEDSKPSFWKVLNSFGVENNQNGYFTMSNDFFDENVFLFAINKKYL